MTNLTGYGLYSKYVFTADGIKEAVVIIREGKISDIIAPELAHPDCQVEDLSPLCLLPGMIDSHVHVNEPGRTEREGFRTATRAAAAGGITTIADMPLASDPATTTVRAFKKKLQVLQGILPGGKRKKTARVLPIGQDSQEKLWADCVFYGGIIPGNTGELEKMIEMGVAGFKCFLTHPGIDGFPQVSEEDLRKALPILSAHKIPLLVHAELCSAHRPELEWKDRRSYQEFLSSRPAAWEKDGIDMMIRLCREFHTPIHIVNLSSWEVLPAISAIKREGLPFTVETCPHYLTFEAEQIPDGDPRFKCLPPIRGSENRERLWRGLTAGLIDFVASDHSPCLPEAKLLPEGDLKLAAGGISSLQFLLPLVWTEARKRGLDLNDLVQWLAVRPAQFLGLSDFKGAIKVGHDADLIAFDPDQEFFIEPGIAQHKHKLTPYEGRCLKGVVRQTYLRGRLVHENGKLTAHAPGNLILPRRVKAKY